MLKIRNGLFETNSSSADRYSDSDYPRHATAHQKIRICLKLQDDIDDDRLDTIYDELVDTYIDDIINIASDISVDLDDWEYYDIDNDSIVLTAKVIANVVLTGRGYAGDRYSPPEPDEFEFEYEAYPFKNETNVDKKSIIERLTTFFKEHGYNEIIGVENVYGEDIDENEFYDNMS